MPQLTPSSLHLRWLQRRNAADGSIGEICGLVSRQIDSSLCPVMCIHPCDPRRGFKGDADSDRDKENQWLGSKSERRKEFAGEE